MILYITWETSIRGSLIPSFSMLVLMIPITVCYLYLNCSITYNRIGRWLTSEKETVVSVFAKGMIDIISSNNTIATYSDITNPLIRLIKK